jgi:hypothetical protein
MAKMPAESALDDETNYYAHKQNLNKDFKQPRRRAKSNLELIKYCEEHLRISQSGDHLSRVKSTDVIYPRIKPSILASELANGKHEPFRMGSLPNFLDFSEYKSNMPTDDDLKQNENDDREWVRTIWNRWFDEVIGYTDRAEGDGPKHISSVHNSRIQFNSPFVDSSLEMAKKKAARYTDSIYELTVPEPVLEVDIGIFSNIESEMSELNARIVQKQSVFDLARRGCLYRKVGFFTKFQSYSTG